MTRIGLLTGTFDPVHSGHIELAKAAARAAGDLDGVWLAVNASPEHKTGVADYGDRLAMATLAVAGEPDVSVYDGAQARGSHRWRTFVAVARELGGDPVFVLGVDTLAGLDRWEDVGSVVKSATYLAARRGDRDEREVAALRERLGALGADLRVKLFDFEQAAGASSARIRAAVRAGERPEFLDARVHDYILRHGLYR